MSKEVLKSLLAYGYISQAIISIPQNVAHILPVYCGRVMFYPAYHGANQVSHLMPRQFEPRRSQRH